MFTTSEQRRQLEILGELYDYNAGRRLGLEDGAKHSPIYVTGKYHFVRGYLSGREAVEYEEKAAAR